MSDKSNLVAFPGGEHKSKADKLLKRFVDVFLIADMEERKRQFEPLRIDIFYHVTKMENRGSK